MLASDSQGNVGAKAKAGLLVMSSPARGIDKHHGLWGAAGGRFGSG